jgi:hypothetical protein
MMRSLQGLPLSSRSPSRPGLRSHLAGAFGAQVVHQSFRGRWPSRALGDLELLLSSPVNARSLLAARAFSIAINALASCRLGCYAAPLRRRIGSRNEFRRHGRGGSEFRVVKSGEVLLRGPGRGFLGSPRGFHSRFGTESLLVGVGRDQAGVDRKSSGLAPFRQSRFKNLVRVVGIEPTLLANSGF